MKLITSIFKQKVRQKKLKLFLDERSFGSFLQAVFQRVLEWRNQLEGIRRLRMLVVYLFIFSLVYSFTVMDHRLLTKSMIGYVSSIERIDIYRHALMQCHNSTTFRLACSAWYQNLKKKLKVNCIQQRTTVLDLAFNQTAEATLE